jgi:hypothetical protein
MNLTESRVRELIVAEFSELRAKLAPKRASAESRAIDILTVEFANDEVLSSMIDEFRGTMREWFMEWVKKELRNARAGVDGLKDENLEDARSAEAIANVMKMKRDKLAADFTEKLIVDFQQLHKVSYRDAAIEISKRRPYLFDRLATAKSPAAKIVAPADAHGAGDIVTVEYSEKYVGGLIADLQERHKISYKDAALRLHRERPEIFGRHLARRQK